MFKVMSRAYRQYWHVEYFSNEAEARAYANKEFKAGAADVELYARTRTGYNLVNGFHCSKEQAIENFVKFATEDAPCFI